MLLIPPRRWRAFRGRGDAAIEGTARARTDFVFQVSGTRARRLVDGLEEVLDVARLHARLGGNHGVVVLPQRGAGCPLWFFKARRQKPRPGVLQQMVAVPGKRFLDENPGSKHEQFEVIGKAFWFRLCGTPGVPHATAPAAVSSSVLFSGTSLSRSPGESDSLQHGNDQRRQARRDLRGPWPGRRSIPRAWAALQVIGASCRFCTSEWRARTIA